MTPNVPFSGAALAARPLQRMVSLHTVETLTLEPQAPSLWP